MSKVSDTVAFKNTTYKYFKNFLSLQQPSN